VVTHDLPWLYATHDDSGDLGLQVDRANDDADDAVPSTY